MFNGWKITNILDVGPCELDTVDGPYSKTGYRLEQCTLGKGQKRGNCDDGRLTTGLFFLPQPVGGGVVNLPLRQVRLGYHPGFSANRDG